MTPQRNGFQRSPATFLEMYEDQQGRRATSASEKYIMVSPSSVCACSNG